MRLIDLLRLLSAIALLCPFAFADFGEHGSAQQTESIERPNLNIRRIDHAGVKIDGRLDEAVWKTITPVTNFVQLQPDEGAPVSERTEAMIFYDDENLYIGVRNYDREPSKIPHRLGAHDATTRSDSIDIGLDTFHDRRTGYFFSINCRGIQYDAVVSESGSDSVHDETWDGIWYSAARVEDWGWAMEVAIPFKSIRISRAPEQIWGLNLMREIVRKNERAFWTPVTRFDGGMRPSKNGTMTGLRNVHVGRNLELIPFFSTKSRVAGWDSNARAARANTGLDLRYGLASNLTATATINPDFGDTEADEFNTELSRFEIFYPEKRKFFTEGANYFSSPLQLFFSRRIGAPLPDGEPQRIYEGGKITGKVGRWTIGALQAVTQSTDYTDAFDGSRGTAPGAFFGVVRVSRDIFSKSSIGFMTVNRLQGSKTIGQQETSHAVDLNLSHGEHIGFTSQIMVNTNAANPGVDYDHVGWTSRFSYNSDLTYFATEVKYLGPKVDMSNTGYEPETDRYSGSVDWIAFKPMIKRRGIRQVWLEFYYSEKNGTQGELQDSEAEGEFRVQFMNFWELRSTMMYNRVRFFEFSSQIDPATNRFVALDPMRIYIAPRASVELTTNDARAFTASVEFEHGKFVEYGENFYGVENRIDVSTSARIGDHMRWELSAVQSRESLMNGAHYQDRRFLISRWNYQFTPKLRARTLAQYSSDKHGHNLSINSLVAYDFTARSALFAGYNHQQQSPLNRMDLGNQFFFKLSYLFSY